LGVTSLLQEERTLSRKNERRRKRQVWTTGDPGNTSIWVDEGKREQGNIVRR
jgi:hypothetical protein